MKMNSIQISINEELRQLVKMDRFKQTAMTIKVKNTSDRKCRDCGSDNIYVMSVQTRSADEATTKKYECLDCGNEWSEY